ncbi:MAG: alpha/beta hydrolase, partial [Pseudomonadales bacterium]|nr:alpha/beta hydrolase [Pseudomonadales bacterium]
YLYFIERLLARYSVTTLDNRGAWPGQPAPVKSINWRRHVADFIDFAERQYDAPVHYVGHSLGATVGLMAAVAKPSLFKSLVMIDPGTTPTVGAAMYMRLMPDALRNRVGLIRSTAARRNTWPDRESFIAYIATRSTYRNFTRRALHDYAFGGLESCSEGFRLRFAPLWEAHNFKTTAFVWPQLKNVKVPTLLLRGEKSNIFSARRFAGLCEKFNTNPRSCVEVVQLDSIGHLAPQEGPEQTASVVLDWLAARSAQSGN